MIDTERLLLRPIAPRDHAALMAQSQDAETMRFLLPVPDQAAFDAMIERLTASQATKGYAFWTIERRDDGAFLGLCGLKDGAPDTPIADDVEIGWRLGRDYWGRGFAREAASATLEWAWVNTAAPQIAAITVPQNVASWGLMERLGMTRDLAGDFDHPLVPNDSLLRRHITYSIARPA
ncbi:MAG: GNAT family N-acetyltransferase [Pseudomonadota bacterium]